MKDIPMLPLTPSGSDSNFFPPDNLSTSSPIGERRNVAGESSLEGKVNTMFEKNQQLQGANQQSLEESQSVRNKRKYSSISESASSPSLDPNFVTVTFSVLNQGQCIESENDQTLEDILRVSFHLRIENITDEYKSFIIKKIKGMAVVNGLSYILRLPSEWITSLALDRLWLNVVENSDKSQSLEVLKAIPDLLSRIRSESFPLEGRRSKERFVQQCVTKIAVKFWSTLYLEQSLEPLCEILLIVYPTLAFPNDGDLYKKLVGLSQKMVLEQMIDSGSLACFTIGCYLFFRRGNTWPFNIKKISNTLKNSEKYRNFIFIIDAMQSENLDVAIHKLEQIKGHYEELAWTLKGGLLIKQGEFEKAISCLNQVLNLFPCEVLTLTFRGGAYREIGSVDLAIKDLNLALEIDPNERRARRQRGICWYQKGKMSEAFEDYRKLVNQPEERSKEGSHDRVNSKEDHKVYEVCRYQITLGRQASSLLLKDKFEEACHCLTEALRCVPHDIFSLSRRGQCLILMGQGEEALSDFERVFALDSKHLFSLYIRGQYFFIQGEESRALEDFNAVLNQDANHRLALLKRAEILFAQNKSDLALADLDKILEVDPSFVLALALQARILYARGEFRQAMGKSNGYLRLQVNAWEQLSYACTEEMLWIWRESAFHYYRLTHLDQILQWLESMIKTKTYMHEPYFLEKKLEILLELKRMDELDQLINWEVAHQLGGYFQYLKLKKIWNKQGEVKEKLLNTIEDCLKRSSILTNRYDDFLYGPFSNRAFFLKLRGHYLFDNGRFDQAKKDYLSVLQFSPSCDKNNEIILERVAYCYLLNREIDLADHYIMRASKLNPSCPLVQQMRAQLAVQRNVGNSFNGAITQD